MTLKELYERQDELEEEIQYEEERLEVCAYGTSDLCYINGLYGELEEIKQKIEEKEGE